MTLYLAYGSNMDPAQMERRCPGARRVGEGRLPGRRLAFAGGVATVVDADGATTPGVLWHLSAAHLAALDRYEGTPTSYVRVTVPAVVATPDWRTAREERVQTYVRVAAPTRDLPELAYVSKIRRAYDRHGWPLDELGAAIAELFEEEPAMPAPTTRIFVYGSLLSGLSNHWHLAGCRLVATALTAPRYHLASLGSFPALVPARRGGTRVKGEVWEVDADALAGLDRLEGHPRFYRREPVELAGSLGRVEAYMLEPAQVAGRARVASGDWRAYIGSTRTVVVPHLWTMRRHGAEEE